MSSRTSQPQTDRFEVFAQILANLGVPVGSGAKLLDFGCGAGTLVKSAFESGIDAYGCDIDFGSEWVDTDVLADMRAKGRVRQIERPSPSGDPKVSPNSHDSYRLPFADATFDVIISDQVLEHVLNFNLVVAELHRVMRPGGVFLHIFPSRYRPVEPHIFVPFAQVFRPTWWLYVCAALGLRNPYQSGLSIAETVADNRRFLSTMVNYLTLREIRGYFEGKFTVRFVEREFMRLSPRAGLVTFPALYRTFASRVLFGQRR